MPPRGQVSDRIHPDATPEGRKLAVFLADLCRLARKESASQQSIADAILVSRSSLSDFLRGRRIPSEDVLVRLWTLADHSSSSDGPPPLADALEARCDAILSRHGSVPGNRANVPKPRFSRPAPAVRASSAPPDDEALRYLQAGREGDAYTLLWHAGRNHTPSEIRDAVAAYHIAGRKDAAETLLSSAAARDAQAVLRIVGALLDAQRPDDAATLVSAAIRRTGSTVQTS
ncbi:helix-turn-helix domain-containing protein [Streptomyces sp. NPDC018045]|uniref:helix-turn-helix domain-containing protein n=1 Tax=Streptomyces sp. NPDC018045 TaxID=3365037 RepID=UPI0037B100CD